MIDFLILFAEIFVISLVLVSIATLIFIRIGVLPVRSKIHNDKKGGE